MKLCQRSTKWYGWKPDFPDHRDRFFALAEPVPVPDQVDLRPGCPKLYDQGQLGSCTANAIAAALEFDQIKAKWTQTFTPSRLFIYWNERFMEGTVLFDAGAQIRDGIKSVNAAGAPPETDWPYKITQFRKKPSAKSYKDAKDHPSVAYARVNPIEQEIKQALATGFPIVFGFTVYESFESQAVAKTGKMPMPAASEKVLGGHAVLAVGYLPDRTLIVRNSWGSDWGDKGYFYMPLDYATNPNLCDDFWTITQVK